MPDLFASTDPHTVFLHPGECYFGGGPTRIATLLGSCVSITVWHPRLLVGGMCHYMLPSRQRPPPRSTTCIEAIPAGLPLRATE